MRRIYTDEVDSLIARISSSSTVAWYLTDRLGSVRKMTDNSGVAQNTIIYDGFGGIVSESNSSYGDRYKYTGREWDVDTGLQYNRARFYDPTIGRWLNEDPIGFDAGDEIFYRYVTNASTLSQD